jgi:hypothetical protein
MDDHSIVQLATTMYNTYHEKKNGTKFSRAFLHPENTVGLIRRAKFASEDYHQQDERKYIVNLTLASVFPVFSQYADRGETHAVEVTGTDLQQSNESFWNHVLNPALLNYGNVFKYNEHLEDIRHKGIPAYHRRIFARNPTVLPRGLPLNVRSRSEQKTHGYHVSHPNKDNRQRLHNLYQQLKRTQYDQYLESAQASATVASRGNCLVMGTVAHHCPYP